MKTPLKHRIKFPPPSGFTLIETIGALAVVALIVGVVAQAGFERMKRTDRASEAGELSQIITGIERAVVRTRSVPTSSNWVSMVASQLAKSTNQIARNRQGQTRVLIFDPAFRIGPAATNTLPYLQAATGSLLPANARAVLVSSTAAPLPTLTTNDFATLWNTVAGTLPANFSTGWGGAAADVKIERLDFSRMFRRVILNNLDSTASAPYGIDGTNIVTIAPLQRVDGWFVDTSLVNLYFSTLSLQARETLAQDTSYVFENGRWGRSVSYGAGAGATPLAGLVDAFIESPPLNNTADPGSGSGGTTDPYDCTGNDHDDDHGDHDGDHDDHDGDHDDHGSDHHYYADDHDSDHDGWDDHDCDHNGWDDHDSDHNGHDDDGDHGDDVRHGCNPRKVAEACHKVMKSFSEWSNRGCPRGGLTPDTEHPDYRNVKTACAAARDFTRNLNRR